jgi:peptide/nickel transport system substrate-binding protein
MPASLDDMKEGDVSKRRNQEMMTVVEAYAGGELSRRDLVRKLGVLGGGALFGGPLAARLMTESAAAAGTSVSPYASARFQEDPPAQRGGAVVAATIDKPVNMDPAFAELYSSMQVYQNIFSKLVYTDANFQFIPGLAKSWNQVDPTTWDFELVDNAVFHNDEPFTSKDVAFTFERLFDPELGAPNAVFFGAVDKVEPQGDYNVRITLKHPWGSFLADLAAALEIVNEKAVTTLDPRLEPVGTGPFKMTDWVKDDHITLDRWDKYFATDRPYLDQVIFKAIADDTVRLTGLQTGELQWAMQIPLQKVEEMKQSGGDIKATTGAPYLPDFIYFNCSKPPFDDKRVRQAIGWSINRDEIVKVAFFGQAIPATEAINPDNPLYSGVNVWEGGPDYEKAKALLAEAGMENLTFNFDGQPQVPTQVKSAQVLQQQLKNAGITMNIQNYESGEWITRLIGKEYEATISYWSATLDPAHFYRPGLYSTSGWNSTGYGTPEMDAAIDAFTDEVDPVKRKEAYAKMVALTQEDVPIIGIDNQLQQYWVPVNVYGMVPLPSMEIRMETVYFG